MELLLLVPLEVNGGRRALLAVVCSPSLVFVLLVNLADPGRRRLRCEYILAAVPRAFDPKGFGLEAAECTVS